MTKYIVEVEHPSDRNILSQYGKVGDPKSLNTILIFETTMREQDIRNLPGVVSVEPEQTDIPFDVGIQRRPDSWFLPSASNTEPDYQFDRTGQGVAIYVMDSGIRFDHIDFQGRDIETVFSYDGYDYGGDVAGPNHGTMAASCAAGNLHGIAKGASIYNVRYNWTSTEGIKALDSVLAHHKAHTKPSVLSMSFGSTSNVYRTAFNQLAQEGVILVAAAGNWDEPHPRYPALRDDVIAVAACDRNLQPSVWASSSMPGTNYGPEVDVWAGGTGGTAASIESSIGTQWAGGTSSACPLVAGMIALILEGQPKPWTYANVLETKNELIRRSRKDVIRYTDAKFDNTPNRYIFTLIDSQNPDPGDDDGDDGSPREPAPPETEPRPVPDVGKDKNNTPTLIAGALVLFAILVFLL